MIENENDGHVALVLRNEFEIDVLVFRILVTAAAIKYLFLS